MIRKLNFSWVIPDLLAASSIPTSKDDLEWIVNKNKIFVILSLTEDKLSKKIKHFSEIRKELQFSYYNIPTADGTGFFPHQFDKIVKIFNNCKNENKKMLIHCEGGLGRTSTALTAIWMNHYKMNLEDSIQGLKRDGIRPQAIYTELQLQSLREWEKKLL